MYVHMPAASLEQHPWMVRCNHSTNIKLRWQYVELAQREGDMEFSLYVWEDDSLV